jgi:hypothetical protein
MPADNSPSRRAVQAIGTFTAFVSALDRGRLRQADREQTRLKQLGFQVDFRPLAPSQDGEGGR